MQAVLGIWVRKGVKMAIFLDQFVVCGELGLDWLQSLKQFFINVPYHIIVASLTLMALF